MAELRGAAEQVARKSKCRLTSCRRRRHGEAAEALQAALLLLEKLAQQAARSGEAGGGLVPRRRVSSHGPRGALSSSLSLSFVPVRSTSLHPLAAAHQQSRDTSPQLPLRIGLSRRQRALRQALACFSSSRKWPFAPPLIARANEPASGTGGQPGRGPGPGRRRRRAASHETRDGPAERVVVLGE
jgi:hypothetical protein